MKTCPVCKSQAFDDAEVCYGCLYRFEWGDDAHLCSAFAASDDLLGCEDELLLDEPELPRLELANCAASVEDRMVCADAEQAIMLSEGVRDIQLNLTSPATVIIRLQGHQVAVDSVSR